jgi:hypothetical protein
MHEMGHAIGLAHEMVRTDRWKFIDSINGSNIIPNGDVLKQFSIPYGSNVSDILDYDYCSIMHYSPFEFAKNKSEPVFEVTNKSSESCVGQRNHLSDGDIASVKFLYSIMDEMTMERVQYLKKIALLER